ncbi:MAG: hypothetical protein M1828_003034 [Chrysothrix sp. TS-e1954]|nr:MAG: hypothetical protein M1828_003034 [Chrysothrix sp. TS-e1954]
MPFASNSSRKRRAPSANKDGEPVNTDEQSHSRIRRSGSKILRMLGSRGRESSSNSPSSEAIVYSLEGSSGGSSTVRPEKTVPTGADMDQIRFTASDYNTNKPTESPRPEAERRRLFSYLPTPPATPPHTGNLDGGHHPDTFEHRWDGSAEFEPDLRSCTSRVCTRMQFPNNTTPKHHSSMVSSPQSLSTSLMTPQSSTELPSRPVPGTLQTPARTSKINIPSFAVNHGRDLATGTTSSQETASPYSHTTASPLSANVSTPATSVVSGNMSIRSTSSVVCQSPSRAAAMARNVLSPIFEVTSSKEFSRAPTPENQDLQRLRTVILAEKVAATKVYIETHYSNPEVDSVSARSIRQRKLELDLSQSKLGREYHEHYRERFFAAESAHLRLLRVLRGRRADDAKGISAAGYEILRILGKGSFGVVRLVREKSADTGERPRGRVMHGRAASKPVFAMKVIRKSEMLRNCQEAHLRAERDFLVSCAAKAKWVVPLVASFQDVDNLYLILEFEIGGDFLGHLLRRGILKESHAKFYIAEMILCVEETHRMKWIHRDIKPDNFLIASDGHLKISDFGLAFDGHWSHNQAYYHDHRYGLLEQFGIDIKGDAKDQEDGVKGSPRKKSTHSTSTRDASGSEASRFKHRKLARSVVGTSQYMAPEVVRGLWYDGRCDWWSIGIILYECLWGFTPFSREDRDTTKAAILDHRKCFAFEENRNHVSYYAQDLIFRLLQEPEDRLCSPKYRRNDFLAHLPICGHPSGMQSKHSSRQRHRLTLETAEIINECAALGIFDLSLKPGNRDSQDYAGRYVYQNDAEDIKSHPFFADIPWDYIHHRRPPFVPKVQSLDSTRYFESEAEILGSSADNVATAVDPEAAQTGEATTAARMDELVDGTQGAQPVSADPEKQKKQEQKKRPRDKLLRDPTTAKSVMEVRKKHAFLGYTYRRPKTWSMGDELRLAAAFGV